MIGLFIPCLVDQFYPEVGEAVADVLERLGQEIDYPEAQTCCGLPFFNMGRWEAARPAARHFLNVFEPYDAVVTPASSCAAMVRRFYGELFAGEPRLAERARALAQRTHELASFLVNVLHISDVGARFRGTVACHRSCHLREIEARDEAETLIRRVAGTELVEMPRGEVCCGFGGAFAIKFPILSGALGETKCETFEACGADVIVTTDAGCMLHLNGLLHRRGSPRRIHHLAELLAGRLEGSPRP